MYRITLRVSNVDLDDDETLVHVAENLSDLLWSTTDGRVTATIYAECRDPVGVIIQTARRITHALPSAEVSEVDQDLVSVSDIGHRLGVHRETVRLWTEGKRGPGEFPAPVGALGGTGARNPTRAWRWADVNEWLTTHYMLSDPDQLLTPDKVAEANANLRRLHEYVDREWTYVKAHHDRLIHDSTSTGFHSAGERRSGGPSNRDITMALDLVTKSRIVPSVDTVDEDVDTAGAGEEQPNG